MLTAVDVLRQRGWALPEEAVRRGLAGTVWPGRFELLQTQPPVFVDGGHNPQCMQALAQNLRDYLPGRSITALTGVMADKQYDEMYRIIAPLIDRFVAVTPDNPPRAARRAAGGAAARLRKAGHGLRLGRGGRPRGARPDAGRRRARRLRQPLYGRGCPCVLRPLLTRQSLRNL